MLAEILKVTTRQGIDGSYGSITYLVRDESCAHGLPRTNANKLPFADDEIRAATNMAIGSVWPLGKDDGASLPGALVTNLTVSRRSAWHAWVMVQFQGGRWGGGPYPEENGGTRYYDLEIPFRKSLYSAIDGSGNRYTVWTKRDPVYYWPRAMCYTNKRVVRGPISDSERQVIKNNIGKLYSVHGTWQILADFRYTANDALNRAILIYTFTTTGSVPAFPVGTDTDIPIPALGPLEEYAISDASLTPVIQVRPVTIVPAGEDLPGLPNPIV